MSYSPMYATLSAIEIKKLATLKAPASVWAVTTCLNAFAQGKTTCFPSIQTIVSFLDDAFSSRAVHRALKWLEDNELIERKHRRSRNRFVLKLRALAYEGIEAIKRKRQPCQGNYQDNPDNRKEKEKNQSSFSNKRSQFSSERSKSRSIWAKKRAKNKVGGSWCLGAYEPDKRSKIEQECDRILTFYFTSQKTHQFAAEELVTLQTRWKNDASWVEWMLEHNREIVELLGLQNQS